MSSPSPWRSTRRCRPRGASALVTYEEAAHEETPRQRGGGGGNPKPSSQKATGVSMWSTIHPKFMPKNPVMNVSGTKIVATTLTR